MQSMSYIGLVCSKITSQTLPLIELTCSSINEVYHRGGRRHGGRLRGYSIIGSGSGFTVNLGSDSLGKSNDFRRV